MDIEPLFESVKARLAQLELVTSQESILGRELLKRDPDYAKCLEEVKTSIRETGSLIAAMEELAANISETG